MYLLITILSLASMASAQEMRVSLSEAQETAVRHNAMLLSARKEVSAAKARLIQTGAGFLPSVRITETWMRTTDAVGAFGTRLRQEAFTQADFAVDNLNRPDAITDYETKLEVRQPLFNGGSSWMRRGQAGDGVKAAEAGLQQGENEVRFRTAQAYWGFVLAEQGLTAVRAGLDAARSGLRVAEAFYKEEMIPLSDLLEARVRVAELMAREMEAVSQVESAREGLSLMMGQPADAAIVAVDSLDAPSRADASSAAVRNVDGRPDIVMETYAARAARKGARASVGSWVPHVNAFFDAALDADNAFGRDGERWTVGAVLSWDLFSGGRTVGAIKEARASADAAEARLTFAREKAEREIRQAVRDLGTAKRRLDVAHAILAQSAERHRVTGLRFGEGLATTTDLVASEAAWTEAQVKLSQALFDVHVGEARLAFVTGG